MKVLLAGASGAIGAPLVQQLRTAGHEVTAIHRSPAARTRLITAGATPLQVDVLDRAALLAALKGYAGDAVISQLSAMKKSPTTHDHLTATNRLRTEGTANLLAAAEQIGARRFITQSMVFGYGYGDFGGRVLTEEDEFAPTGHGRFEEHLAAMRSNEDQVLGAPDVQGIALRYGLFYGPGAAGDTLVDGVRRRRMPVIRSGGVQPWVHIDDAAAATRAALEHGVPGSAYNIVDDEPVSFSELITATAAALGAPRPLVIPAWLLNAAPYAKAIMTGGLRVSNAKACDELEWAPRWPTHRDGIATLVAHYPAPGHGVNRRRPNRSGIIRQLDARVLTKGMRLLLRLGVAPKAFALLETTGRRSRLPQQTPVGNGLIGDTFWLIAARGEAAHYVRNLQRDPGVRVKIGRTWRDGVAEVLPDDDPDQRLADILTHFGWLRRLDAKVLESSIRLLGSTPLVVRITVKAEGHDVVDGVTAS